jgi:hypothetical protein
MKQAKNFTLFMESAGSLPFLQAPPIGLYPEPAECSTHLPEPFLFV